MRIPIPGRELSIRVFEEVATVDEQYNCYDIGVEQGDGSIDSVVIGGSFSLIKSIANKAEDKAAKAKAKKAKKRARKAATKASEAVAAES